MEKEIFQDSKTKKAKTNLNSSAEFAKCKELTGEISAINPFAKGIVCKIGYKNVDDINDLLSPLLSYSNRINNGAEELARLNPKAYKKFLKVFTKSYEDVSNHLHKFIVEESDKLKAANDSQAGTTPNN